jgi:hypothetical protein
VHKREEKRFLVLRSGGRRKDAPVMEFGTISIMSRGKARLRKNKTKMK